eukprot:scaffold4312_cov168-Pinguiococcus_pyrenoidosus.AAC.2
MTRNAVRMKITTTSPSRNDTSHPTLSSYVMFAPKAMRYVMQKRLNASIAAIASCLTSLRREPPARPKFV